MQSDTGFIRSLRLVRTLLAAGAAIALVSSSAMCADSSERSKAGLVGPVMTVQETQGTLDGPPSLAVTYSQDGRMVQQVVYFGSQMTENTFTVYDSQGKRLRRSELKYGPHGEALTAGWSDMDYSYDGRGEAALSVGYGTDGAPTTSEKTTNTYQGTRKTRTEISSTAADGTVTRLTCLYEYDAKGNPSRELWYGPLGAVTRKVVYSYDARERLVTSQTLGANGAVTASENLTYDGTGRLVESLSRGPLGVERFTYRYGPNGEQVGSSEYRDGSLVESTSVDPKLGLTYVTSYFRGYTYVAVIGRGGFTERQVRRALSGKLERDSSFAYELDSRGNWRKMTRNTMQPGRPNEIEVTYRTIVYYPDDVAARSSYYQAAGRVVDESGKGIGGATVALSAGVSGGSRLSTTDVAGNWFAAGLSGPSEVTASKDGWSFEPVVAVATRERPLVTLRGRLTPDLTAAAALEPASSTVVDKTEGAVPTVALPAHVDTPADSAPPSTTGQGLAPTTAMGQTSTVSEISPARATTVTTQPVRTKPVRSTVGRSFGLKPSLGYSVSLVDSSGPLVGLQATYELGRFWAALNWDRVLVMHPVRDDEDWVDAGVGWAAFPRPGARMVAAGGIGYLLPNEVRHDPSFYGFAEMVLKLGKDSQSESQPAIELALGMRAGKSISRDGSEAVVAYTRANVSGDKLINAAIALVAVALTLVHGPRP